MGPESCNEQYFTSWRYDCDSPQKYVSTQSGCKTDMLCVASLLCIILQTCRDACIDTPTLKLCLPGTPHTVTASQGMAAKTLAEVIVAVPQLRTACSNAVSDGTQGSGIKLMRLVCKQLGTVMLGVVQSYTLQLNKGGAGLDEQMSLLQDARLSCLRVVVTDDAIGGLFFGTMVGRKRRTVLLQNSAKRSPRPLARGN